MVITSSRAPRRAEFDLPPLSRRRAATLFGDDTGAATAEYAVATIAAIV